MNFKIIIRIITFISIAYILSVFLLYFFNFSFTDGILSLKLSEKQEAWGQFGDFVGGTVNSFFSFASFIALLITVYLQRLELVEAKNSLIISNELNRTQLELFFNESFRFDLSCTISEISKIIDSSLAHNIRHDEINDSFYDNLSINDFISNKIDFNVFKTEYNIVSYIIMNYNLMLFYLDKYNDLFSASKASYGNNFFYDGDVSLVHFYKSKYKFIQEYLKTFNNISNG
ncbi:MAG: hypothetical protein LBD10_02045 [Desulfobulbus sp.]|jgi:hypothetical protein|uniref:hypothetical protein n=1 Tax=Desulfobulbus sp. TaxID=895 RepID=UPI00284708CD|nr:hypothetical protein [Desulfobulbus sp.]MDR2548978.1 hypothetical protein [Desulfobulbus sp.]